MTLDAHELGTILGVWAHPDDEAYLSGALMALAVDEGRRVVCVTATRGEAGFPDDDGRSADQRRALRTAECAASMEVLGVSEHQWLNYPDGGCHLVDPAEPVAKLTALIAEIQPDTVLTFGPDGMTGHTDHTTVSRWTTMAVRQAAADAGGAPARLLYATNTEDWNRRLNAHIDIGTIMMVEGMEPPSADPADLAVHFLADGPILDRKVRALLAQASQVEPLYKLAGDTAFRELMAEECFREPEPGERPADD